MLMSTRRAITLVGVAFATAVLAAGVVVPTTTAVADDPPIVVTPGDPSGRQRPPTVAVGVSDSGTPARPGQAAPSGGPAHACRWVPAPEMEAWLRRLPSALPAGGAGGVRPGARLFARVCGGVESGFAWFGPAAPVVVGPSPADLAREAYGLLRLPAPEPGRSPDLRLAGGGAAVLVGEHTWLWTSRTVFSPRARLVRAGGVWARVTAVPVGLSFDPGTGEPVVVCAGPGTPYVAGRYGLHAPSPTCGVVLTRSSARFRGGVATATWAVRWRVSWVGAAGGGLESGVLAEMVSRTSVVLAVAEAQALVTG
jgi:hypothetical protein